MKKCPFLKRRIELMKNQENIETIESFQECIIDECMAWNAHDKECRLMRSDFNN